MMIFRRALLFLMIATMVCTAIYIAFVRQGTDANGPFVALLNIAALIGVLVWGAVFLKAEPLLTRIALIFDIFILCLLAFWVMSSAAP